MDENGFAQQQQTQQARAVAEAAVQQLRPAAGNAVPAVAGTTKFCSHCGSVIAEAAVICPHCGCQVGEYRQQPAQQPNIVINNSNNNVNTNTNVSGYNGRFPKAKNKWVAFLLCLFLGFWGAHKFYEGKILLGIVYIFTVGVFGIGIVIDLIRLLFKPNPYYV